jgi:O-antigen ligase
MKDVAVDERGLFDFDPAVTTPVAETLRRVSLGLTAALMVTRAYFPSEAVSEAESGRGLYWVLTLLLAAGLGVVSFWIRGATEIRWSWADLAVIALVFFVGQSASAAPERRLAINLSWDWIGLGVAYLLLRWLPRTRAESSALSGILVAAAVAVAVYGIYQAAVELPNLREFFQNHRETAMRQAGVDPNSPGAKLFEDRLLGSTEPFATFALANSLAGYLVGAAVLGAGMLVEVLARREAARRAAWRLWLAFIPLLALVICLLLTKSRAACVGLAVGVAVLAWRYRARFTAKTFIVALLVLGALFAGIVVAGVAARQFDIQVVTESTKSLRYRWEYWHGAWGVITERASRFWFGWGPGNFAQVYLRHKLEVSSEEIGDPHNLVLETWAIAGVFAAIALIIAIVLAISTGLRGPLARPGADVASTPKGKEPRSTWLVASAAVGGLILVIPIGGLDPVLQPDLTARWTMLALGWGLALLCGLWLWKQTPVPSVALGAGALALVVNLLVAGGIGMAGVALMLWSLLALAQNSRDDARCGQLRSIGGRGAAFLLAAVWVALLGRFYRDIRPYWEAQSLINAARHQLMVQQPDYDAAQDDFLNASRADVYGTVAHVSMAELTFSAWRDRNVVPPDKAWQQIARDLQNAVKSPRNPDSIPVERTRAMMAHEILERGGPLPLAIRTRLLDARVNALAKICRMYPSSAAYHASLADALAAEKRLTDALREGREALRLDSVTPHKSAKLPKADRARLEESMRDWAK